MHGDEHAVQGVGVDQLLDTLGNRTSLATLARADEHERRVVGRTRNDAANKSTRVRYLVG
jgi:hypothetical protein